MKIMKKITLSSAVIIMIATPSIMVSCSSTDQNYVDNFYSNIIDRTNWTGQQNVYASSIYDLKTFRAVFKDQLPTDAELLVKGYKMALEDITPGDSFGSSTYNVYLRNSKTDETYLPTPTTINNDYAGNPIKESVVTFTITGFLLATPDVENSFQTAYKSMPSTYNLNSAGKEIFKNQNIETSLVFDDPNLPSYIGNLFEFTPIPGFAATAFQKESVDNLRKEVYFLLYLSKDGKILGPGKLTILKLN